MSSQECLRESLNERPNAAAEEISGVSRKTIAECKEESELQRRWLDAILQPEIRLKRIELSSEVLADHQRIKREAISNVDQEEPASQHIKEEEEDLCTALEGEQLVLKQEIDTCMLTPSYEESDHREPELNGDQQLLSNDSHVAEKQNQKSRKHGKSRSAREGKPTKRLCESRIQCNNVNSQTMSKIDRNTEAGKKSFKCDTCGQVCTCKSQLDQHVRIHTGEKPYPCKECGKSFNCIGHLKRHMRIHTDEKPYPCKECGKSFTRSGNLKSHMRIHTGEKPYPSKECDKSFSQSGHLKSHMKIHTGEKPYPCKECDKSFRDSGTLKIHMRIHTGEKPYPCKECGKRFRGKCNLVQHMKSHQS